MSPNGSENRARAVFVDRDGVLNAVYPEGNTTRGPRSLQEVRLLPGVYDACQALYGGKGNHCFTVIGVTNQPDVGRGKMTFCEAEAINGTIMRAAWITTILACYHDENSNCYCRKPRPGLLLQAAAWHDIDLARSYMVGDRETDVAAGKAAGCKTIRIGETRGDADFMAKDFPEAARIILEQP